MRSPDYIYKGQYIDSYRGEIITLEESEHREEALGDRVSYLFELDPNYVKKEIYVVDGRKYGSITRFLNHSCNPNLKMFLTSQHFAEENIFDIAFFAVTDIPPGTELRFDYYPKWKEHDNETDEIDPDAVRCLCGEKNCRGQLWPNRRKNVEDH